MMPRQVEIVEVAPRDGLQMLAEFVPTADKINLIRKLQAAGCRRIEAAAFVSSRHVPQMADAEKILAEIGEDKKNLQTMVLALNEKGYLRAIEARPDWICYVTAATEAMSLRNANTTIADGIETTKRAIKAAHKAGIKIRASIAVCWVCPYEGKVAPEKVLEIAAEFTEADEIAFNDTVGRAVPSAVFDLCSRAKQILPKMQFAAHFHDTNSTALANVYAALTANWTVFDASAAGLGGCPFSPGASGNAATEKIVWMLEQMNIETGIDLKKLQAAADFAKQISCARI
jgi:hydroxymethylglutaryl-CoA lyase